MDIVVRMDKLLEGLWERRPNAIEEVSWRLIFGFFVFGLKLILEKCPGLSKISRACVGKKLCPNESSSSSRYPKYN